jgi:hypothetical protein
VSFTVVLSPKARSQLERLYGWNASRGDELMDAIQRLASDPQAHGQPIDVGIYRGQWWHQLRLSLSPWTAKVTVMFSVRTSAQVIQVLAIGVLDARNRLLDIPLPGRPAKD